MNDIVLSICQCGRNDDYGLDFNRRFVQSVNFLAWSAKQAGVLDKLEVVFADWNSDAPLSNEIRLSEDAAKMVRFIEIPPAVAEPLNFGKTPFHTCKSLNVAYRRARGKFLAMMPGDILFTQYALRPLFHLLEGTLRAPFDPERAVIAVPRKLLPFYVNDACFFDSPESIQTFLFDGDFYMQGENFSKGLNGGYGMFMFHRDLFFSLRGLNENIGGWGFSDIEIALRAAPHAKLFNTAGLGIVCYDFEPNRKTVRQKRERMPSVIYQSFENGENWGLPDQIFHETSAPIGNFVLNPRPVKPESCVAELLERLQFLPLSFCKRISKTALAAGSVVLLSRTKKVLVCETSDSSISAMLSLANPLQEITFQESFENGSLISWQISRILAATRHIGHIHFQKTVSPDESFDLIITSEKLPGRNFFEIPEEGLFLYGASFDNLRALDLRPLNGNIFTRIHFPEKMLKLWNILGRLGFSRWIPMLKQLRKNYHK